MAVSQWHKWYTSDVAAPPAVLFGLLADMPNYGRWLPGSTAFGRTTDVEPYPVRLGSRYHDGQPGEPGKDWWGTRTGFQPPGSLDFHHTITLRQLRATVDVHIHYSLEPGGAGTRVSRWREIARQSFAQFQLAQFSKPGLGDIQGQQRAGNHPKDHELVHSETSLRDSAS